MKLFLTFCAALSVSLSIVHAQNTVVLIEEDYEDATRTLNAGNNGASVTEVADPAVGGTNGTVAAVDLSGSNQWGAVNAIPQSNLALPIASVPGTDTFFGTIDVYIDSANTTFNAGEAQDRFNLIFRFNRGTDDADRVNRTTNRAWESLLMDQWQTITIPQQAIPEVDNTGAPITHVLPIISIRDQGTADGGVEAEPGIAVYFDNFRIDVTVPADDPNLGAPALSFGVLEQSTGPHTRPLTIFNTGTDNALTVTAASFTGANADLFSIDPGDLPLQVDPGTSADLTVTFSPGAATGEFAAEIVLTSNDQGDPTSNVALSATVNEPFQGIEMIINGGFETGDLTGWRDDDRFDYTGEVAHSGNGAAVFTMTGSQEWGEARVLRDDLADATAIVLTPDQIGKRYEYSAWYLRPAEGGPEPNDTIRTIFRWNAKNPQNHTRGLRTVGDIPVDTWIRVTGEGTIPEFDHEGVPVDHVVPLWSFQDVARDGVPGRFMYIDDVSFKIEGIPPLPDLKITEIVVDEEGGVVRITWPSVEGAVYGIDRAETLNDVWLEQVEEYPADAGEQTVWEDSEALGLGEERLFYRVRLLEND